MGSDMLGALVEFMPAGLIRILNVIVLRYNPESVAHGGHQPEAPCAGPNETITNPLAVKGNPGESFSFTLALDAADSIADGSASAALAKVSGVYTRLAALEMLLYPANATKGGLLGVVTAAVGSLFGAKKDTKRPVPANQINTVLFVWGPGRIVPLRVTALTVTERLDDIALNPTKADVQITLRVLTDQDLLHDI